MPRIIPASIIALLLTFAGLAVHADLLPKSDPNYNLQENWLGVPLPNELLCLPLQAVELKVHTGRRGTAVPIGPHEALTAAHCVQEHLDLFVGDYYPPITFGILEVAGNLVREETFSSNDSTAVRLEMVGNAEFPAWFERGTATTGTAFVIRYDIVTKITITDTRARCFTDWRPFPGSSGSAIVQKQNGKWLLVGIVTHVIYCETCRMDPLTNACPKIGIYANVPTD